MAFKIKEGLIVDDVTVFNDSGVLQVNAPAWQNDLTLNITGDATGSATFNGDETSVDLSITLTGVEDGTFTGDFVGDVYSTDGTSKVLESGTDGTDATFIGNILATDGVTAILTVGDGDSVTATFVGDVTGTVSDISNHDTDDLAEGSTNLYYTDTRARAALSGSTGITYNSTTGAISIDSTVATLTGTQTLTNKTLTNPTVNAGSGTIVLPTSASPAQTAEGSIVWDSDGDLLTVGTGSGRKTMVDTDSTQTLANKTLTSPTITGVSPVVTVTLTGDVTGTANATLTDLGNGTITVATTVAADSVALGTDTTGDYVESVAVSAGTGLSVTGTGEGATVTLAGVDATAGAGSGTKGVASFDSANFSVTSGHVTIKDGGIANAELVNDSITIGSTEVTLGTTETAIAGLTQLDVDNVRIDGNVISTTNTDGDLTLTPNGSGNVVISSATLAGPATFTIDPAAVGDATGTVIINGNLTVQGTTTTVNSNEVNIGDNIIVLNADETGTPSQSAGIEVERGTSSNVSFTWDESNDYWTVGSEKIVADSFEGDIISTSVDIDGGAIDGTVIGANTAAAITGTTITATTGFSGDLTGNADTASALDSAVTITLSGDVTGTATFVNGGDTATITTTIAADSVALGTDTTGDYVATIAAGTGVSVTGAGTEGRAATVALSHLGIESLTDPDADRILFWDDSAGAAEWLTVGDGLSLSGTTLANTQQAFKTISVSGQSDIVADQVNDTLTIVGGDNITVTTNAATDTITITNDVAGDTALESVTDTVTASSTEIIDSFDATVYRSGKYYIQVDDGTNFQVSEVMVIHNGTTADLIEYGVLELGTAMGDVSVAYNAGTVEVSFANNSASAADVVIKRVLLPV